jgi:hypothetical protein
MNSPHIAADYAGDFVESLFEFFNEFFVISMGGDDNGIVKGRPGLQLLNIAGLPGVMVVHL